MNPKISYKYQGLNFAVIVTAIDARGIQAAAILKDGSHDLPLFYSLFEFQKEFKEMLNPIESAKAAISNALTAWDEAVITGDNTARAQAFNDTTDARLTLRQAILDGSNSPELKAIGTIELQGNDGEFHVWEACKLNGVLYIGSYCNAGFILSYWLDYNDEYCNVDDALSDALADLQALADDENATLQFLSSH